MICRLQRCREKEEAGHKLPMCLYRICNLVWKFMNAMQTSLLNDMRFVSDAKQLDITDNDSSGVYYDERTLYYETKK